MDISVLRFSNVYGKRDYDRVIPIWIDAIRNNKSIKVYGGDQILDFIPVSYVVDALIKASKINLNGLPVNVGSGQRTNILDLANLMKLLSNKNIEIIIDPARKFEINNFVANTVRMKDMLGIKPPMSPLHYISEMIQERI